MYQTLLGLLLVAVTALAFWWKARHRYQCPFCGRYVQWKDVNCPHCGNDMNFRHRDTRDPGAKMMTWSKSRAGMGSGQRRRPRH